jgi:hypothetical protein
VEVARIPDHLLCKPGINSIGGNGRNNPTISGVNWGAAEFATAMAKGTSPAPLENQRLIYNFIFPLSILFAISMVHFYFSKFLIFIFDPCWRSKKKLQ